jgi:hypothetical protein
MRFLKSVPRCVLAVSISTAFQLSYADTCSEVDSIQDSINTSALRLQNDYPMTFSSLKNCVTKANTKDEVTGCLMGACATATLGATNDREGCIDFGSRLSTMSQKQNALTESKSSLTNCTFRIKPLF